MQKKAKNGWINVSDSTTVLVGANKDISIVVCLDDKGEVYVEDKNGGEFFNSKHGK
ncbi:hypothetical protein [Niabella ginsenosidivorans]|uniref:hypothetical protein n=1 Tax=Niabella ginsenosidivorans TaxID=1176587 RepID=UPI0012EE255B|nr:hypothetical protein [Niabella ginsenosidivorans]